MLSPCGPARDRPRLGPYLREARTLCRRLCGRERPTQPPQPRLHHTPTTNSAPQDPKGDDGTQCCTPVRASAESSCGRSEPGAAQERSPPQNMADPLGKSLTTRILSTRNTAPIADCGIHMLMGKSAFTPGPPVSRLRAASTNRKSENRFHTRYCLHACEKRGGMRWHASASQ